MTIYLTTGQMMRLAAGHTMEQRRYFGTTAVYPNVDTTAWSAAWRDVSYNPDTIGTPWTEITDLINDDSTTFKEWSDDEVTRWGAHIEGDSWNSDYLSEGHAVLCLFRLYPDDENASGWSNWRVKWLGYVKSKGATQDYRNGKEWEAEVEGVAQFLEKRQAAPEIIRRTNVLLNQPVRTSTLLEDMSLEAGKGEFLGLPTNSGQNLVDGDDAVPCIWDNAAVADPEEYVKATNADDQGTLKINEVYLQPPTGYGNGYQWFEIVNIRSVALPLGAMNEYYVEVYDSTDTLTATINFPTTGMEGSGWVSSGCVLSETIDAAESTFDITNSLSLGVGDTIRIDGEEMHVMGRSPTTITVNGRSLEWGCTAHFKDAPIDKMGNTRYNAASSIGSREFVVICENRRRFDEMFHLPNGVQIFAWQEQYGVGQGNLQDLRLDTTGGRLVLKRRHPDWTTIQTLDVVTWGALAATTGWDSIAGVTVPAAGKSFKRKVVGGGVGVGDIGGTTETNLDSNQLSDWTTEDVPTPGRRQAYVDSEGKPVWEYRAWASVQTLNLTCTTTVDLVAGDTTITVTDTNGFYQTGNALVVDTETAYTDKTATTFTIAAWEGATVPAGTRIYAIASDGARLDNYPITSIGWKRKRQPVPSVFAIYATTVGSPAYPGDSTTWDTDWTLLAVSNQGTTAKLVTDIADADAYITVDSALGWPKVGTIIVKQSGGFVVSGLEIPDVGGETSTPTEEVNTAIDGISVRYKGIGLTDSNGTQILLEQAWHDGSVTTTGTTVTPAMYQHNTSWSCSFDAIRAAHVLMVIDCMSDGTRAKLNSLYAWPDTGSTPDPDMQVDGIDAGDFLKYLFVDRMGLPSTKYSHADDDTILPEISSQAASYMAVARDLCRRMAGHIRFNRADGIRYRLSPWHPLGSVTGDSEAAVDWTFDSSNLNTLSATWGERGAVSQVIMRAMLSDGTTFTAAYPAVPLSMGEAYTYPETVIVKSERVAHYLAQAEFYKRCFPLNLTLTIRAPMMDWCQSLLRCAVEWTVDTSTTKEKRDVTGMYVIRAMDEKRVGGFPNRYTETKLQLERLNGTAYAN